MEWLPIQTSPKKDPNAVRAYGLNFLPGTWKEKDKINPKKKKKLVEDWIVILFYARKQVNIHLTKPQRWW